MKTWRLAVVMAGMLAGLSGPVHAESVKGIVALIDAQKKVIGVYDSGQIKMISVKEFLEMTGSTELEGLDVGQPFAATIGKGKDGTLRLVSVEKPAGRTKPSAKDEKNQWLKLSGESPVHPTDERDKPRYQTNKDR